MRIFLAVRHAQDPKQFYSWLWQQNLYPALKRMGHEIVESQVDLLPASRFLHIPRDFTPEETAVRADITERIIADVKQQHQKQPIDLFLSYFYNSHFDPSGFDEIHRLGIPTVNFYCNSIYQFELVAAIAARVQYSWHAEKHARASYLTVGANPIWVQMGAEPTSYHPVDVASRLNRSCFIGQRYADRDRWLAELVRAGVAVDIYGSGWGGPASNAAPRPTTTASPEGYLGRKAVRPGGLSGYLSAFQQNMKSDGPIEGIARTIKQAQYRQQTSDLMSLLSPHAKGFAADISTTFSEYEVTLNFSNVWGDGRPGSKLIPHVRLRDFEAPMCRTCYVTGHSDEISEFYVPGAEIVTYSTPEEFVDKVRFHLNNPAVADKIRNAGYERAKRDHTWDKRYEQLFNAIGLAK